MAEEVYITSGGRVAGEIYIVRDQITPANEVTIKQLIEENIKLRAGVIDAFEVIERGEAGPVVTIKKAAAWHFGKAEAATLPDQVDGDHKP